MGSVQGCRNYHGSKTVSHALKLFDNIDSLRTDIQDEEHASSSLVFRNVESLHLSVSPGDLLATEAKKLPEAYVDIIQDINLDFACIVKLV